jgi:biofilm PGA synthesis N-glycosyltransferase PgaC
MIEGIRSVKPWNQPRGLLRFLTGPYTLAVLPLTLVVNLILYRFQRRRVFNLLGLRVRRNAVGFVGFVLTYQMLMSPVAVVGYGQELLGLRRRWK